VFIHAVYFWLKRGAPETARAKLLKDCRDYLAKIPAARHLWAGPPAMTPRPVVDNTYDVGLLVAFDDRAGHDAYQDHPLHQDFIARNQEQWQKVQVYDFE
jgi:hypothetical protein